MALDLYDSHRETRDNLGSMDENKNIVLMGIFKETLGIEMGPTALKKRNIVDAFALGIATNAILGITELGEDNIESLSFQRVVNPNNIFHEHFRFNTFVDTTTSTGDLSLTEYVVNMDIEEIYQTDIIFKNIQSIQSATVFADISGGSTIFIASGTKKHTSITEGKNQFD